MSQIDEWRRKVKIDWNDGTEKEKIGEYKAWDQWKDNRKSWEGNGKKVKHITAATRYPQAEIFKSRRNITKMEMWKSSSLEEI